MRVASRFLLPLEIFLGLLSISWGVSALFMNGALHSILESIKVDREYGGVMIVVGSWMMLVGLTEWIAGYRWCEKYLHVAVSCRAAAAFVTCLAWSYNGYLFWTIGLHHTAAALVIQTPMVIGACVFIYIENLKVRYALDARYSTPNLHFHR